MSEKVNEMDTRALALLQKLIESRKDDGQGMAVKILSGDQAVELSLTAKPSQYSKGGGGGGGGSITPRSVEEIKAALKKGGISELDSAVAVEGDKVFVKWPYADKDNAVMAELKLAWDPAKKARWAPLKGAAAPSP